MLLFKVRVIRSPHMGEFRGFRMALATPNESGFAGNPSFIGKFLVAESGDMTEPPTMLEILAWIQEHARDEAVTFLTIE